MNNIKMNAIMKMKKIFLMLCLALPLGFISCGDDDEANTHTDASVVVPGTYNGSMTKDEDGSIVASDVTLVITKNYDNPNTQAVDIAITAPSINMNQQGVFNVAKTNDGFTFGSGSIASAAGKATKNCGGRLNGNVLIFYLQLNSTYKFSGATAAKRYTLHLAKN